MLGSITRNVRGMLDFTLPASGAISTSSANANFAGGSQSILGGYATVGGTTFAVSGTGATAGAITGLASYSSGFAAGADVDAVPGVSTPGAMTINSLRFSNEGAYAVNTAGNLTIATGGLLVTSGVGANSIDINNNQLTSGNGQDLIINQNNTAGVLTINSAVVGAIALTKAGEGTLVLGSSLNSYTGGTYLQNGTLRLSNAVALPTGTITFGSTTSGGTLDVNGFAVTLTNLAVAIGALGSSQVIGNSSTTSGATLIYNNADPLPSNSTSSFSGSIVNAPAREPNQRRLAS